LCNTFFQSLLTKDRSDPIRDGIQRNIAMRRGSADGRGFGGSAGGNESVSGSGNTAQAIYGAHGGNPTKTSANHHADDDHRISFAA